MGRVGPWRPRFLESLAMAMAAHNSGGLVLVQVERLTSGALNPRLGTWEKGMARRREVKIPAALVDAVVLASPENHWQTFATEYNPAFSHEVRVELQLQAMRLDERKVMARRGALELRPGAAWLGGVSYGPCEDVVNLGVGVPEGVALVCEEEGLRDLTLTTEPGVMGGIPAGKPNFGAAVNVSALLDQPSQFDFYAPWWSTLRPCV